ncbi:alanine--tRNA ligase [Helicobacter saguini]|uniref:Alanine--tRNA ligase n=1 Tax=Helicobacter saguini TaxID=1548018 RepID=A0A347VPI3_9HELI|nr:alanine--tRNA ligase [Helicobacter saguini]MWV61345.1 alanine--tRNA ligase [Helicobacter saguini]MWV67985.1 alanine--tRNA ligase [Helicobacter saguini]MWV70547.1 alanine--tRNA ligase [Helicobacter saguini]MWV72451.1 alanine--tRNA ligase [Helicobacter saguini]TLD94791.1 alanine--tRNA ligase [Helicobacter saguini]
MDIRSLYLDYFEKKGHKVYSSMPLVPDDASLLFTNAGMVQFKDIFTGKIPIPKPPRATSSQLCIRAGGKHNDLENVGYTARHHTLFEMLGNFSFGDYFKKEAIAFAWEFVTQILKFDKNDLYVTVHESDDEAFNLWCEHISPDRIKRMGDKDNFWQMGDTGPCGPCSEIYVDQGDKYFNTSEDYFGGDGDRFLEIWNLVFMQYEQRDGVRKPLPKPSIDTGMGLERVIALKEGKINNFDTSLFAPLMSVIERLTGEKYYHDDEIYNMGNSSRTQSLRELDSRCVDERLSSISLLESTQPANLAHDTRIANPTNKDSIESIKEIKTIQASFRVIADHSRSVAFLLAQGVNFDKEGRGYVLRRILRRAVRHGYLLGLRKAFLYEVVGAVCDSMGQHYTYLIEKKDSIQKQCKAEEERFFETIESGMELFSKELDSMKSAAKSVFSGETAFKLYDTFGFPLDLTQDMLREHNLNVDLAAFESCMQEQKNRSKASWKGSGDAAKDGDFKELITEFGENKFVGYESMESSSVILAMLDSNFKRVLDLKSGEEGYILLNETPFYPESGGPVGDKGSIESKDSKIANVIDTKKYFGLNLSKIKALKPLKIGEKVIAKVSTERYEIAKHHSATHLLHYALREILGTHIAQAGSLVEANRLRFDFSHTKPVSSEELEKIQDLVNEKIMESSVQICEIMDIEKAKNKGAMALFGEKYGNEVRVITFGDSIELCGGIHVANTAEIGSFYIIKESGVSSGVRRIEAVCGHAAYLHGKVALDSIKEAKEMLKAQDVLQGITRLKTELKELKNRGVQGGVSVKKLDFEMIGNAKLIVSFLDSINANEAKDLVDKAKNENEKVAILIITLSGEKIAITAGVKGISGLKAGAWVKEVASILGGNGGGRDDFATAGGKDSSKIPNAINTAKEYANKIIISL